MSSGAKFLKKEIRIDVLNNSKLIHTVKRERKSKIKQKIYLSYLCPTFWFARQTFRVGGGGGGGGGGGKTIQSVYFRKQDMLTVNSQADPDLQIRGGHGHPDPEIRGVDPFSEKLFSALRASVWFKNRGGGGGGLATPGPSPGSAID